MAIEADDALDERDEDDPILDEDEGDEELAADAEGEEDEDGEEDDAEPTVEDIARSMGWTPKDKWRGDPRKWSPAHEYIRKGAEWRREHNQELRELRQRLDGRERITQEALARLSARHEAELRAARREAIKAGDERQVEAIDREIEAVRLPVDEEAQAEIAVSTLFQEEPAVARFFEDHAWALEDEATGSRLIAFWDVKPGREDEFSHFDAMDRAETWLRRTYPERYERKAPDEREERRRRAPPEYAETGRMRRDSYASRLTDDERREAQSLVKEGLFKSVEEYGEQLFANRKGQRR